MSRDARIRTHVVVAVTVLLAALALAGSMKGAPPAGVVFWCVACLAGELLWFRLPLDRATVSMGACFNFAALLVLDRGAAMIAASASVLLAELLVVRKPPVRAFFNAAQTALSIAAGSMALHAGGAGRGILGTPGSEARLLPVLLAAVCYYVVNRGAVSIVIAASQGVSPAHAWRVNFGSRFEILASGTVLALGYGVAMAGARLGIAVIPWFVLPLMIAREGYRRSVDSRPASEGVASGQAA